MQSSSEEGQLGERDQVLIHDGAQGGGLGLPGSPRHALPSHEEDDTSDSPSTSGATQHDAENFRLDEDQLGVQRPAGMQFTN
jgi:hypothetical protein